MSAECGPVRDIGAVHSPLSHRSPQIDEGLQSLNLATDCSPVGDGCTILRVSGAHNFRLRTSARAPRSTFFVARYRKISSWPPRAALWAMVPPFCSIQHEGGVSKSTFEPLALKSAPVLARKSSA